MDPYQDVAALYDCEHDAFNEDVAFYLDHVTEGPVLEIGSGTGRITQGLLRSGLEVWGVDPSAAMLDRSRIRLAEFAHVHLVLGTVADLPPELRFGTAILPLNTLWHLPDSASQLALLHEIHSRLDSGGMLLIDVSNPLALAERGARGEIRVRFTGPCRDGKLTVMSSAWDDEASQHLSLSLIYDTTDVSGLVRRTHAAFGLRYLYRYELELVLRLAGFTSHTVYGSYDGEPYLTDSANIVVVARAV